MYVCLCLCVCVDAADVTHTHTLHSLLLLLTLFVNCFHFFSSASSFFFLIVIRILITRVCTWILDRPDPTTMTTTTATSGSTFLFALHFTLFFAVRELEKKWQRFMRKRATVVVAAVFVVLGAIGVEILRAQLCCCCAASLLLLLCLSRCVCVCACLCVRRPLSACVSFSRKRCSNRTWAEAKDRREE